MTDVERSKTKLSARLGLGAAAVACLALYPGCPDPGTTTDGGITKDFAGSVVDMAQPTDGGPTVQPVGCSVDAWCWQFPSPQGNALLATWGSSAQDVWAVGGAGTIVHYDGSKWSMVRSPTNNALYAIWGSSANNIFAVGDRGTVLRWDGSTWTRLFLGTDGEQVAQLYGVWGADASEVWFIGNHLTAGSAILKWNGTAVTRVNAPAGVSSGLRSIWGAKKDSVYIAGESGTLIRWDGTAWSKFGPVMSASWSAITGTGDNNIFLASRDRLIYRWNGTAMANVSPAQGTSFNTLWSDGTAVFAAGDIRYPTPGDPTKREGMLLKWDGTSTFSRIASTPKVHIYGLWGTSTGSIFFSGAAGTMGRFDGSSFQTTSTIEELTGNNGAIYGLSIGSQGDVIAVGDSGGTLVNKGGSFTPSPGAIGLRIYSVTQLGSETLGVGFDFAQGKGVALKWNGSAWMPETVPTTDRLVKIASDGTNAYAVGDNRAFLVRSGGTWKQVSVPLLEQTTLRDIAALDSTHVWLVGGGDKTETNLGPQALFYNGNAVLVIPSNARYTGASGIFRSVWASDQSNVFIVGSDYGTVGTPMLKWDQVAQKWTDFNPITSQVTSQALLGVWGRSPTDVYAVGKDGMVLHFNGSTWNFEQSGTENNLVSVTGNASQVFITGVGGSILRKALR